MNRLEKAAKVLSLAVTYAEDGAVVTAIELATDGLAQLLKERDRRIACGLLPKRGAPASVKMVTGPGTFRTPRNHSAATRRKMAAAARKRG